MSDPVVLSRANHPISRAQIDPDALKVLYRLHQHNHIAYLVGGSVRDLLLGRHPKDFDIGTSAHPYQVKKIFRNCWIVGRRFRLAHVRFGTKTIEVATFRRHVTAEELAAEESGSAAASADISNALEPLDPAAHAGNWPDRLIHRDNTFGTPEEDAFRRDFTVNALFYNIADFSIIDYTGGLRDLDARIIHCIGDPNERFREDPVRMMRAVAMAARLGFSIDRPIDAAIDAHRAEIARSSPPRLMEEFYKILRAGHSEQAFRMLAERKLLEPIAPALQEAAGLPLWRALAALDTYRRRFASTPDTLTNAILLGSLLIPLGYTIKMFTSAAVHDGEFRREPRLTLGMLPLAKRDVERLRQILSIQRRLMDGNLSPRGRRALMRRGPFADALTWLEIHGNVPEIVEHWRGFVEATAGQEMATAQTLAGPSPRRRHRRRRRTNQPSSQTPS
jgi:poly(A) polymerase